MKASVNPFPDYQVSSLTDGEEDLTVSTVPIERARALVSEYLLAPVSPGQGDGKNIAVVGDFGTGKTHLLRVATHLLRQQAETIEVQVLALSAPGLERTPCDWYRTSVGPQLVGETLDGLLLGIFAGAAKTVAARAPLTASAVAAIEEQPMHARALVEAERLSASDVEVEYIASLDAAFGECRVEILPEVRQALLVWLVEPDAALGWLRGGEPSDRQRRATGLAGALDSDELVGDVLVAVAAIARQAGAKCCLAFDEIEHFILYESPHGGSNQSRSNVTWLKRLIERLQRCGALTFVAGHPTAWEGHPDFLDRFSSDGVIQLQPLTYLEVMQIVETFLEEPRGFDYATAERVAAMCNGNMRRVLATLRALSATTDGFNRPAGPRDLEFARAAGATRVDIESALADIAMLLADRFGLRTNAAARLPGSVQFDLVAFEGERPRVVVEVKHAAFGPHQQDQAQRFIEKVKRVASAEPGLVGLFVFAGQLDEGLRDLIESSAAPILTVDLADAAFRERVVEGVQERLRIQERLREQESLVASPPETAAAEADKLEKLSDEIGTLKREQAEMYNRLQERLEQAQPGETNIAYNTLSTAALQDPRQRLYEEYSSAPTRAQWFAQLVSIRAIPFYVLLAAGVVMLLLASNIASSTVGFAEGEYTTVRIAISSTAVVSILGALLGLMRLYVLVDRFYTFKRNALREVYLDDHFDAPVLTSVNNKLDEFLERRGPVRGRLAASNWLAREAQVPAYAGARTAPESIGQRAT